MLIYNVQNIIPAGTVMNTNLTSQVLQLENMYGYAIQIVWTGTPTGSFSLQASCDPVTQANQKFGPNGVVTYAPTNWSTVANSSYAVSAAGDNMWSYGELAVYNYVRVVYTDGSSGDSTATITVSQANMKCI